MVTLRPAAPNPDDITSIVNLLSSDMLVVPRLGVGGPAVVLDSSPAFILSFCPPNTDVPLFLISTSMSPEDDGTVKDALGRSVNVIANGALMVILANPVVNGLYSSDTATMRVVGLGPVYPVEPVGPVIMLSAPVGPVGPDSPVGPV